MDWQPIETAPRDGTWVLLTGGKSNQDPGDEDPPMVVAYHVGETWLSDDTWQFAIYDSGYYGRYAGPTHWMPLPAPPTA